MTMSLKSIIKEIHTDFSFPQKWVGFWSTLPHVSLLHDNAFSRSLAKDQALYLISATDLSAEEIRRQETINAGMGCLCAVIYCVQGYKSGQSHFDTHNFGRSVMLHKDYGKLTAIVFSVSLQGAKIQPFDYLKMGPLFWYLRTQMTQHDTNPNDGFNEYLESTLEHCRPLIDYLSSMCCNGYIFSNLKESRDFIDKFVSYIYRFKTLSYVYFEACSLALLLLSKDDVTNILSKRHEFNNYLYVRANQLFLDIKDTERFESYGFSPNSEQLITILQTLESEGVTKLNSDQAVVTIANGLLLFSEKILSKDAINGMLFYDFYSSNPETQDAKRLIEEEVSLLVAEYRAEQSIDIVFNSTIPKGEIGVCSKNSESKVTISYGAYVNENKSVEVLGNMSVSLGLSLPLAKQSWKQLTLPKQ